jgi:hypothetical protein
MRTFFYLFSILLLSLLLACSEEPPTNVDSELLSKKPTPPPPPDQLPALYQGNKYIAGVTWGDRQNDPRVFIWNGSNLSDTWSRSFEENIVVGLGHFIDDDDKELLVIRKVSEGKKKNQVSRWELLVFKEGDTEPSETVFLRESNDFTDAVWDMKVGNVDADPDLEIVIAYRDQIEIWEYDDGDFYLSDFSYYYSSLESPWRADFGDFDGDNVDEIIVAFAGNYWRVYDYNGSSITSVIESSAFNEIGNLDCAKISDVNNDGTVEVIGGNYPDKVLLWEAFDTDPNEIVFKEFPSAPWAIGVGEIDNDPSNGKEILAGVGSIDGGLHLLHYNGNSFTYNGEIVSGIGVHMDGIIVTDINNNNSLEIIVSTTDGLKIYDNNFGSLFTDDVGLLERIICQ